MGDNDMNNAEIFEELIRSLKNAYKGKKKTAAEECPMQEAAIAYATLELDVQEQNKFRDHLLTCRSCLDLVLDVRTAVAESKAAPGQSSKVLPALSQALGKSAEPSRSGSNSIKLKDSIARCLSGMMSPKFLGSVAAAGLAFIVIQYGLEDSEVSQQLSHFNTHLAEPGKKEKRPGTSTADMPSPARTETGRNDRGTTPYESAKKSDPFEPSTKNDSEAVDKTIRSKRIPVTPLERIALSQLKLVGIILSENGNRALLEDPAGKGHVIREGTYIGLDSGKVMEITKDKVVIEEQVEDIVGKLTTRKIELKLSKN